MGGCDYDQDRAGLQAHADRLQHGRRPRQDLRRGAAGPVAPNARRCRWAPSIRCSSSTPPAPPASPRACSTPPAATCCGPSSRWTGPSTCGPNDVFWCTADIGWITGHTYVAYGPLAAGATQVVFEGIPTFPHAGRFWQMIEKHKVTIFYTAPTAIRSLIKAAESDEKVHPEELGPVAACASSARSASRSIPKPGCGTTGTWAASAARSSTPSGRPRPAAT